MIVTLVAITQKSGVRVDTRDGQQLALTRRSGALLRYEPSRGWQLEIGEATPGGTLRAMGRSQLTGFDALNALQRLVSYRLSDGASEADLRSAEGLLAQRGNPFLARDHGARWPHTMSVNGLAVAEQLALELAASEALIEHQAGARGRNLEERFKAEAEVASIVRQEID